MVWDRSLNFPTKMWADVTTRVVLPHWTPYLWDRVSWPGCPEDVGSPVRGLHGTGADAAGHKPGAAGSSLMDHNKSPSFPNPARDECLFLLLPRNCVPHWGVLTLDKGGGVGHRNSFDCLGKIAKITKRPALFATILKRKDDTSF